MRVKAFYNFLLSFGLLAAIIFFIPSLSTVLISGWLSSLPSCPHSWLAWLSTQKENTVYLLKTSGLTAWRNKGYQVKGHVCHLLGAARGSWGE